MEEKSYLRIVAHYEDCLARHGDNHKGVDWPNADDLDKRFAVMLDLIKPETPQPISLLDFGCGTSLLYEYLRRDAAGGIEYAGLDLSPIFTQVSKAKYPENDYYCADILEQGDDIPPFDYIVMNGVFTEKRDLSFSEMLAYFKRVVSAVFAKARIGIAFNVMSKQVDWERDDLFHLSFDDLATFLTREISRHFVFRHDYGLYEYTTYVYKSALERGLRT